ncbi:MAG: hypothetical protein C5B49_03390 [Bdellovibrio sp.]|nr:MAG: hypothetical protein C5B49_03390 [Bdellovibrio sp.]
MLALTFPLALALPLSISAILGLLATGCSFDRPTGSAIRGTSGQRAAGETGDPAVTSMVRLPLNGRLSVSLDTSQFGTESGKPPTDFSGASSDGLYQALAESLKENENQSAGNIKFAKLNPRFENQPVQLVVVQNPNPNRNSNSNSNSNDSQRLILSGRLFHQRAKLSVSQYHLGSQPGNQAADRTGDQPADQSLDRSDSQALIQPGNHPENQPSRASVTADLACADQAPQSCHVALVRLNVNGEVTWMIFRTSAVDLGDIKLSNDNSNSTLKDIATALKAPHGVTSFEVNTFEIPKGPSGIKLKILLQDPKHSNSESQILAAAGSMQFVKEDPQALLLSQPMTLSRKSEPMTHSRSSSSSPEVGEDRVDFNNSGNRVSNFTTTWLDSLESFSMLRNDGQGHFVFSITAKDSNASGNKNQLNFAVGLSSVATRTFDEVKSLIQTPPASP